MSWWLNHPSQKNSQIGSSARVGIKNAKCLKPPFREVVYPLITPICSFFMHSRCWRIASKFRVFDLLRIRHASTVTEICLFNAWKKFQIHSPKWWFDGDLRWYKVWNITLNKHKVTALHPTTKDGLEKRTKKKLPPFKTCRIFYKRPPVAAEQEDHSDLILLCMVSWSQPLESSINRDTVLEHIPRRVNNDGWSYYLCVTYLRFAQGGWTKILNIPQMVVKWWFTMVESVKNPLIQIQGIYLAKE